MRLKVMEHKHRLRDRLLFRIMKVMTGFAAPDVVKTLRYRAPFFGLQQRELTQQVMRGNSDWTVFDRELFAAYVSRLNQCVF